MTSYWKFIGLLSIFIISITSSVSTKAQKLPELRVGGVNLPPFFVFDKNQKGKASGLAVEVVEKIYEGKYRIYWHNIPLGRASFALKRDIIQVYSAYAKSDSLKTKNLDHSKKEYFQIRPSICGPILKPFEGKKLTDLPVEFTKDKNVIFPLGSNILSILKDKGFQFQKLPYSGKYISRSKKMVSLKRADLFTIPTLQGIDQLKNYPCIDIKGEMGVVLSFKEKSPLVQETDQLMKHNLP